MNENPVELFWSPFVGLFIWLSVNFHISIFFSRTFYQTWHRISLVEGDSSIHKRETDLVPSGDSIEILYQKLFTISIFKSSSSEPTNGVISPFSRLNGDWIVIEWWLNGEWMVTGKVVFSHISVTIQSSFTRWMAGTFQWPFRQFIFLITECENQRESMLTIRPLELLFNLRNIWYMCSLCLNLYLNLFS